MPIEVDPVRGRRDLRAFLRLPWSIYEADPRWVPPLRSDVKELLDPSHPFYDGGEGAERELFLARRNGHPVGRIVAIRNHRHDSFHGERAGFFGFFESIDSIETTERLVDAAAHWCAERGASVLRGPTNPSTNYECGLLVDGHWRRPAIMMAYNPPYYEVLLERAGLRPEKDLLAYRSPVHAGNLARLSKIVDRSRRRIDGLVTRGADLKRFRREVDLVQTIYNAAWESNWGFVPLSDGEIEWLAKQLKPLVHPDLLRFAMVDGEPAGFLLALPDWNPALATLDGSVARHPLRAARLWATAKPGTMEGLRVITMGVVPEHRRRGIEGILFAEGLEHSLDIGYDWCEYSWILEDNEEAKGTVRWMDAEPFSTYRIFAKELSPPPEQGEVAASDAVTPRAAAGPVRG